MIFFLFKLFLATENRLSSLNFGSNVALLKLFYSLPMNLEIANVFCANKNTMAKTVVAQSILCFNLFNYIVKSVVFSFGAIVLRKQML